MDRIMPGPVIFRGQTYRSVGEMPAKVRQAYEEALKRLQDAVPSGTWDAWEERGPGEAPSPGPHDVENFPDEQLAMSPPDVIEYP